MANDGFQTSQIPTEKEEKKSFISCGNCGRRIRDNQGSLEIYNSRYRSYEYYHESYLGCYESTRETGRKAILNRYKPWLNPWFNDAYVEAKDPYENWTT